MSGALAFDPWAALKCTAGEDDIPAKAVTLLIQSRKPPPISSFSWFSRGSAPLAKKTIQPETSPPTVATEPDGAADDPPFPVGPPLPVIPLAEQVEAMAQAMIENPVYRITNREKALEYFRANALTRLTATGDPLARGLLLGWERHRGAMAGPSRLGIAIGDGCIEFFPLPNLHSSSTPLARKLGEPQHRGQRQRAGKPASQGG